TRSVRSRPADTEIARMARITSRRLSELAITVLFLALVRTLAEYYRLRYVRGPALGLADVAPYITGGLMAAAGAWAAVVAYFFGRYRVAIGIVVAVVVAMLVYKVVVIGGPP
ncbi:MAG TPA: hypothetical protein VIJ26_16910, partial [Thermoanaerobaculia bacterium]